MILESAIVNLTRNLDILSQKDNKSISSNVKLKEEALTCLLGLIEKAPLTEYQNFIVSENYSILVGYLVNVLCQLTKNDRSKTIKSDSLSIIIAIADKLKELHTTTKECSINPLVSALPGVSSTLFRLIMSDTKLPKNLILKAIKALNKFIVIAFIPCLHHARSNIEEIVENLAIRLSYLIEYVTTNASNLAEDIQYEMLELCQEIVCNTTLDLVNKSLKPIVKYIAFITSKEVSAERKLKIMIISDGISESIRSKGDYEILNYLFKLLDELEADLGNLLPGERFSQLSMLSGFLRLLPQASLTTLIETTSRRAQILAILTKLVEFCTDQPFLFLTDVQVGENSLEVCDKRIYTVEKRFKYLSHKDLHLINDICSTVGENLDWSCLNDVIKNDLRQFTSTNNLYISHLILKGCLKRRDLNLKNTKFTLQTVEYYIDKIHDEYVIVNSSIGNEVSSVENQALKIVISIETITTLMTLHLKLSSNDAGSKIILKNLLCHLLNWVSSNSRGISEASLTSLHQISLLYNLDSTKALIEANIDYIVNGVMHMLQDFSNNTSIVNVLAITFKLSSIDSFYYFRDVYERIFRLLGKHHHTERSKTIALLFYRTVSTISEWKEDSDCDRQSIDTPLINEHSINLILNDISIEQRITKLRENQARVDMIRQKIEELEQKKEDEINVIKSIQSGNIPEEFKENDSHVEENNEVDKKKEKKPNHIELTEKILSLCVNLIGSNCDETKILALKTAACGIRVLHEDEDTLLPLVHQLWSPLVQRLTRDYNANLEINISAFDCLISMAIYAKDFIKGRTLDLIIPRLCLFLESQATKSRGKKDYGPYCMTVAYKCQLKVLTHLGALAYHIKLAYSSLWRVIKAALIYLDPNQVSHLHKAAFTSLHYMIALDADSVWYFAKKNGQLSQLPFELIYAAF